MDLSRRRLRSTALIACVFLICIQQTQSRFFGTRPKRQFGANLYLPESSIVPGGEGDDPNEWTDWSSPSECSRSCGGGVSFQMRDCRRTDRDGTPVCKGGNRKYFSCNTQDCPEGEEDFRALQCAHFDKVSFEGTYYDWVPYKNAPNPCELNCMPKGMRFYYRQKSKVVDGTRCNDKDLDVCVDGQCQPVGCDMMLGSNAKEDTCRECNGDGRTCRPIKNTFTTSNLAAGYNDILIIPSGATNIRVEETQPSNNYLACRNLAGNYYLNGNWRIDFPRPMFYAGSWWNYQRKPTGFAAPDQLTCSGPINESIYIVMLVQDKNVSIDYEYSIPEKFSPPNTPDVYSWTHMEFSPCSASCGGGSQSRVVTCNNRLTLEEVDQSLCDGNNRPAENQECGEEPCAPHWKEGEWGKCSKGCGEDGMQNRDVKCERISPAGEHIVEPDAVCLQLVGNKPATTQECNREIKNCPSYHLGPWTPCDKLCGDGKQSRKVTCFIKENGRKKVLSDEDCVEEKPETEKKCMLVPCEGVDWIISQWSGCDACGQNTETRTAICGSKDGKVYPEEFCAPEVPELSRPCKSKKCVTQWFTSEWSDCSAACGKGLQSRVVLCGEFDGKSVTPAADDSKCDAAKKPEPEQECEGEEKECPGQWFTGPWGKCSKPCGGGEQVREVLCLSNGTKSLNCDESKIESLSEKCNPEPCTEDSVIPVDSTATTIMDDEGDEDCSEEDEDDDGVEVVTDKISEDLKISDGIDLDEETTTDSSLITDELMLSDAPSSDDTTVEDSSTDIPLSTVEGSGEDTDSTDESSLVTEGSGDDTEATTLSSDATDESGATDASKATGESDSTDATTEDVTGSEVTEESGATESTVDSSDASTGSSDDASDITETTDSSRGTDISDNTEASSATDDSVTSDSSSATDGSDGTDATATTVSDTESSDVTATTDASASTSVSDTTEGITSVSDSTLSTESSSDTTDSTTDSSDSTTESSESTTDSSETTTDSATETTISASSESTDDGTTSAPSGSTDGGSDETTVDSSASTEDGVSGVTTEDASGATDSTETTVSGATETTESPSTGETTEGVSEESTVSGPTDETTVAGTEASILTDTTESEASGATDASTSSGESAATTESSSDLTSESVSTEFISTESPSTDETSATSDSSDGSTEESLSTESGATDESTIEVSTESSVTAEEETTVDIWSTTEGSGDDDDTSTPNTLEAIVTKEAKPSKCKAKKSKDCKGTEFGCCPDGKSTAKGPFDEGCPIIKTCADAKFGCCPDGVSPAEGKKNKGCPKSQCQETLFGCCSDKFTPAEGEDDEGCPEPTTVPPTTTQAMPEQEPDDVVKSCAFNEFGCCPDGKTPAQGNDFQGCDTLSAPEAAPPKSGCQISTHGCCPDGRTPASGPNNEGCAACTSEPFGCCPDNNTPAHGILGEGCCLNTEFGCCPDNINAARGPNFEDCNCEYAPYGCCPDKKVAARGPGHEGCGCETTAYGCCPDKLTPAQGVQFEGCACHTMQFGCCPDGVTFAQGPHHYGCHCSQTEFKCCADEKTPAQGPDKQGCTCLETKFGCCSDGVTSAEGEKFEGCPEGIKESPQKACGLPKESGTCGNFSIKYFFDTSYGACARFWYGGCEGNDNRFENEGDCKNTCQDYTGKDVCFLPKSSGACTGYNKKWYFDAERNRCEEFNYGGCYGTNNRFDSIEECQSQCAIADTVPACEQPVEAGPCDGSFERWHYDNETDTCQPFRYGGCKGNKNNYASESACSHQCRQPGVRKEHCSLPKQPGDCSAQHPRWFFSETERRCTPFYYTGCNGNKNNFPSQDSCEDHCPKDVAKDVCEIAAEAGACSNYVSMWYYDVKDSHCRQFYYGGCDGNENRFQSEEACMQRCEKKPEPEPEPEPQPQPPQRPEGNVCGLPSDRGECGDYSLLWYFDNEKGRCGQFYYGGCGGNGNRFNTEQECSQQCSSSAPQPEPEPQPQPRPSDGNMCSLASDRGNCDKWVMNWYYDSEKQACDQFYYGGCEGNENRFESEEECQQRCSQAPPPQPQPQPQPPAPQPSPDNSLAPEDSKCFLPAETGNCDENEVRWYYNSNEGICDEFTYSGCGGNANSYATEDECQNACFDVQTTCTLRPLEGRCDEKLTRWYFDERSQLCSEFSFSGCRGNRNNFLTEAECLGYCSSDSVPPAPQPTYSVCDLRVEQGECDNFTTTWFYDSDSMECAAFTYSGCGGNGNRFATKEQCDRQCGEFRGIDVCNEDVSSGPCRQWQTLFYYNRESKTCERFTYGGCEGTANRFTNQAECESVCIVGKEFQPSEDTDICKLPVNTGWCSGPAQSERRWYYDDDHATCLSFIYAGCSGNQNNFRSYETCYSHCAKSVDTNEVPNELPSNPCVSYEDECRQLRCPFGQREVPIADGCTRCECENPCEQYQCYEGEQCAVEVSSESRFVPVCRPITKAGSCPQLSANSSQCARECYTDADCRGDNKCCSDGCGSVCVRPLISQPTTRPTATPVIIYPGESKAALEPKTPQEVDVETAVGNIAVLRCFATGNPAPNVTWSRQNVMIDTNQGRYVLTSSGDLTIVQVRQTDSGSYVCIASNGLGEPVRREVQLDVQAAERIPVYVYGPSNVTQIVTLNRPAQVRCLAGGYPEPQVTWWRNHNRLPLVADRFELLPDYSLMFRSIQLTDLGPYDCEVYNGVLRPASVRITLQTVGPARALTNEEAQYLQYVLPPPEHPSVHIPPRAPYFPTRPSYVPPPHVDYEPPRRDVRAQATIVLDPRNSYSPGSTIVIGCTVEGYPAPEVTFTKNTMPLLPSERIQITSEPHRLVISDVSSQDSAIYGCVAKNAVSYSTSSEQVNIESAIPVHPDCVDSPHYANCKMIVQGRYCHHLYYAKFCCRSCTLAGALGVPLDYAPHPNAI